MKLILIADVPELGGKGDVVDVAEGYGRNYLLPKHLAVKASTGALKNPVYSHVRDVQELSDLSDAELFINKEI